MFALSAAGRAFGRRLRNQQRRPCATSATKTTDEKAAEVTSALLPKFKKYAIIIVPVAVFSLSSFVIITNANCRDWMDDRYPAFVQFVREYYGFDDEDLIEKQRIRQTLRCEHLAISMNVEVNGIRLSLSDVSGNVTMSSCVAMLRERYPDELVTLVDTEITRAVTFEDSFTELPESITHSVGEECSSSAQFIDADLAFRPSIWQAINTTPIAGFNLAKSNNDPSATRGFPLSFAQYGNVVKYIIQGTRLYQLHGNGWFPQIDNSGKRILRKATTQRNQIKTSPLSAKDMEKRRAVQIIREKEKLIAEYENEKLIGRRQIDDIQTDINRVHEEIVQLKRKHINYFYYF